MSKKKPIPRKVVVTKPTAVTVSSDLLGDVRTLIEQAREFTARAVNSGLVLLYWHRQPHPHRSAEKQACGVRG
ncbi:MAG: hypothetical protein U0792_17640 [Gemmataceae bacterium]